MKIKIYKNGKVAPVDLEAELLELIERIDSELYDTPIPFEFQMKITKIRNHIVSIKNGVKTLKQ
jgi:hypothetical protein